MGAMLVAGYVGAAGCGSFGAASVDPAPDGHDDAATPEDAGGGADGAMLADGPSRSDSGDGAIDDDAGVAAFAPACQVDDVHELEPNEGAAAATVFASAVCGAIAAVGDVDYLQVTVSGSTPLVIAYSTEGNAKLTVLGPGVNQSIGGVSGGGFRQKTFTTSKPPGTYVFHFEGAAQHYRLVVTQ